MSYSLYAKQMKAVDEYSIKTAKIPEAVLMERASLKCVDHILEDHPSADKVCVVFGPGNNGGDGLTIARILVNKGVEVFAVPASPMIKPSADKTNQSDDQSKIEGILTKLVKNSRETINDIGKLQYESAELCGVKFARTDKLEELSKDEKVIIVDAIFGIGLTREVEGDYARSIEIINNARGDVYSVDVPSGINADTGCVMGTAVMADVTVTFGFMKNGLLVYPGAKHTGKLYVEDAGFAVNDSNVEKVLKDNGLCTYFASEKEVILPVRSADSNKGTYGKVLFIGAASGCAGAAYLSVCAAYLSGTGLVKALTGPEAANLLNNKIPEVITGVLFENDSYDNNLLESALKWATCIIIGPGLGTSTVATNVLKWVLMSNKKFIIDADAINVIAEKFLPSNPVSEDNGRKISRAEAIGQMIKGQAILTPHVKEMSRLTGESVDRVKAHIFDRATEYAYNNELTYVCKDAATVVATCGKLHINTNGNNGMSTGGSGDVLAGLCAGMVACGLEPFEAARTAVYLHGMAGDRAAERVGEDSLLAGNLLEEIPECIKSIRKCKA